MNSPDEATIAMAQQTLRKSNPWIQEVMVIQEKHTPNLMLDPNIVGTATGLDENGNPAVLIFLKEEPKTVSITYENECAGGTAFTKTFNGQIVKKNKRSRFLAGGDSGSLIVEDVITNPRAVGLLFAGSSTTAIANPIDHVLRFLNATMVRN